MRLASVAYGSVLLLAPACVLPEAARGDSAGAVGPGGAGSVSAGPSSGSGADGGGGQSGGSGGGMPTTATIDDDFSDGMFASCHTAMPAELLHDTDIFNMVVADDGYDECAAVRFPLAVPKGATVISARLVFFRNSGDNLADDTLSVKIWEGIDVPPFNPMDNHMDPAEHGGGSLFGPVAGWKPGVAIDWTSSPDLAGLLQDVMVQGAYHENAFIGFVVEAGDMPVRSVGFTDSRVDKDKSARLEVHYVP